MASPPAPGPATWFSTAAATRRSSRRASSVCASRIRPRPASSATGSSTRGSRPPPATSPGTATRAPSPRADPPGPRRPAPSAFDDAAALKLDGSSGYVSLGTTNLPAANAVETISVWVKLGSTSGTQDFIALGDGAGRAASSWGSTAARWRPSTWAGTSLVTGTTPVDGAWHNVVYSYDGTNNTLYVDGMAVHRDGKPATRPAQPPSPTSGPTTGVTISTTARSTTCASTTPR